jgi:protein gp37
MAETSIERTDATWNPVAGCTVLTAGCTNCYAMRMAAHLDAMGQRKYEASPDRAENDGSGLEKSVWTKNRSRLQHNVQRLDQLLPWKAAVTLFINSTRRRRFECVAMIF